MTYASVESAQRHICEVLNDVDTLPALEAGQLLSDILNVPGFGHLGATDRSVGYNEGGWISEYERLLVLEKERVDEALEVIITRVRHPVIIDHVIYQDQSDRTTQRFFRVERAVVIVIYVLECMH